MQDSETFFYNLQKQAKKKDYIFRKVYRNFYNKNLYDFSLARLKKERKISKINLSEEDFSTLVNLLKTEKYQPLTAKEIHELKEKSQFNLLPDEVFIKEVQLILQTIFEPLFSEHSHGYRPGKSPHTALLDIRKNFTNITWFITVDLSGVYQDINPAILINIMRKRIDDERFLRLIRKFFKKGYLKDWKAGGTYSGVSRGGALARVFLNIYLNELDCFLEEISRGRESLHFLRYGPKLIIGVEGQKKDTGVIIKEVREFLLKQLTLKTKEQDFTVKHALKPVEFLGYSLIRKKTRDKKTFTISLAIPDVVFRNFISERKMVKNIGEAPWHILHRPSLLNFSDSDILNVYKRELNSFYSYYRLAANVAVKLRQLRHVMEYSCLKTLANKHRSTLSKTKERLRNKKEWGLWDNGKFISLPKDFKFNPRPILTPKIDYKISLNYLFKKPSK